MNKPLAATIVAITLAVVGWALTACAFQVQPCPTGAQCPPVNVTITTAIMATVPVSALPGAP